MLRCSRPSRPKTPEGVPEYSFLTLRFHDHQAESAFVAKHAAVVKKQSIRLFLLGFAMSVATLASAIFVGKRHLEETWFTDEATVNSHIAMCVGGAAGLVCLTAALLLHLKPFTRLLGDAAVEVFVASLMVVIMYLTQLLSPEQVANAQGKPLEEVYGPTHFSSDSRVVLIIDLVITATHLGLPIRWFILLPLQIAGVLLYAAIVLLLGSSEPMHHAIVNLVILTTLVTASSLGKRMAEVGLRQHFGEVIREKSLRCEAEFTLAQVQSGQARRPSGGPRSEPRAESTAESQPTAASGPVFDPMFGDVDVDAQLSHIAEIGSAEHWLIEEEDVTILQHAPLGSGGFGEVMLGTFLGMAVAIKLPHRKLVQGTTKHLQELSNELRVLRYLRHPNIVAFHGAVLQGQKQIALVLELIRGVVLTKFLTDEEHHEARTTLARYQVMVGVCRAILHMHTRKPQLIHGDLKGGNIMVELFRGGAHPKLLDFGLSRVLGRGVRPLGGTIPWAAPEVVLSAGQGGRSADVYSFGWLLFFAATSAPPHQGMAPEELRRKLFIGRVPPPVWPECGFKDSFKALTESCIDFDEDARPKIGEVLDGLLGQPQELGFADEPEEFLNELRIVAKNQRTTAPHQSNAAEPPSRSGVETSAGVSSLCAEPAGRQQQELQGLALARGEAGAEVARPAEGLPTGVAAGASWSPRSTTSRLPGLQKTSDLAMRRSLRGLISRWSCEPPPRACCPYHAAVRAAAGIAGELLEQEPCADDRAQQRAQCLQCGILDVSPEQGRCDVCGADVQRLRASQRLAL